MTSLPLTSTKQALYLLNARCESVLQDLRDLIDIHRRMDISVDWRMDTNPTYTSRLHKASLHIRAIASWQMDGEVLHVMAPEIRAAALALDPLVQDLLPETLTVDIRRYHSFLLQERELISFAHPTPFSLFLSREHGGFANTGYVRYLLLGYIALSQLMATYATAISNLAVMFDPPMVDVLYKIINGESAVARELDWDAILRLADD